MPGITVQNEVAVFRAQVVLILPERVSTIHEIMHIMSSLIRSTFRLQSIQHFAQNDAENDHGEVGKGAKSSIAGHVELKHLLHVEWNLDEEHVPAEVVAGVRNQNGPEGYRGKDLAPWHLGMMFDLRLGTQ